MHLRSFMLAALAVAITAPAAAQIRTIDKPQDAPRGHVLMVTDPHGVSVKLILVPTAGTVLTEAKISKFAALAFSCFQDAAPSAAVAAHIGKANVAAAVRRTTVLCVTMNQDKDRMLDGIVVYGAPP
jgi:hypothetical protein